MRLRVWAGAPCLLPVLGLLSVLHVKAQQQPQPKERHYYVAAEEIDWDYSGNDANRSGPSYKKVVFREYDKDFRQAKTHPSWLGLLGPTLRAEEGETIVVTFRNMASRPHSIHPHGVAYGKQSEGANYFDNTSQKEKEDDMVQPNRQHVYYWEVTPDVSPQPNDPTCLTYTYISHIDFVEDYNSGLIGALLICKPGSLDESGKQAAVYQEYVFLFGVFDERESQYKPKSHADHVKYTINGYTMGSLPDVSMCAYASVSLHLLGMSSEPEVFSVHMNGQVLQHNGHKVSSVGLISGSTATASMVALHTGRWLLSSHTNKHIEVGMHGFVDVIKCDGFNAPRRRMTIEQKRHSSEWTYYIAAEEVTWDYAPNMPEHVDEGFKIQYLKQSSTRVGAKYKKAVYTLYKNESFTERIESKQRKSELGILGPVIRAQIRDVIKIVFKNKASRPYSIYPHGLTIEKSEEGVNYPAGGNQSHGVQPGETHTYVWRVVNEDEPFDADSRCLTRLYHSAVDTPRDIASGLIGQILICKSRSLNIRGVQLKADKEQHAMLAVFDENKSWYLDDNIRLYCDRSRVNKADPDFYQSNVMHTINGYVFESGPLLGFCNGEVATWHMSSIGAQDYIQTATFYGHTFELNGRTEDFLSLYPMTGETITMNMDNIGVWLMASLNSHETTKGVRVKFQDVECFRDRQYEYSDYSEENPEFTLWNPLSLDELKKKDEVTPEPKKGKPVAIDIYTEMFADELGLRSLKNQSYVSDVELLDLSFLDYDADIVPDGETNIIGNFPETMNGNETSVAKPNTLNDTHLQNSSMPSTFDNSSAHKPENATISGSPDVLIKNDSIHFDAMTFHTKKIINMDDNQTSVGGILSEGSEERLTRGDVFSYSVPPSNSSTNNLHSAPEGNATTGETGEFEVEGKDNKTTGNDSLSTTAEPYLQVNSSEITPTNSSLENVTNDLLMTAPTVNITVNMSRSNSSGEISSESMKNVSNPLGEFSNAASAVPNETTLSLSSDTAQKNDSENYENSGTESVISAAEPGNDLQMNSSETVSFSANSSLENVTKSSSNSSEISLESRTNASAPHSESNQTFSATSFSNDTNLSSNAERKISSEELSASDSSEEEEVHIYLTDKNTQVIKTTSVKTPGHNWTYDGTHQLEPVDIPDYMIKYLGKETPQTTMPPPKKKTRKVNLRQRPQKGHGMKTRKRKEYKPQARSGLPFSPRGFNPGMTPRGSRPLSPQPVSDEEELINMPVVIGVPRPDFSDYELYIPGDEPAHLGPDTIDLKADEYEYVTYIDPYSSHEDVKNFNLDDTTKYYLKFSGPNVRTYFIAAEEVLWDYGGYGHKRQDKVQLNSRETKFTKVVFRGYMDSSFSTPDIRGEIDEHLGILGPVIKAEVGQSIMVVFRNNAKRPYSLHPNGVTYTKQTEGLNYEDGSKYWYKYDNEVQPNTTFTYMWKVSSMVGPSPDESQCRTWAYYSGVNPERDIHSGLIGPLLVCREGTLKEEITDTREFTLLFMTFDESHSWYYEKNHEMIQRRSRRRFMDPNFKENLKFHSINGIIYSLKGLRMYTNQLVRWHLINMGSPRDFQSIHFHGQTFLHKKITSYRQAVYPLLPGSFATLEMNASRPGLWQLETEVGFNQKKGMQTLFLVLDNDCSRPLGLESGSVKDSQITAINTRGYWEPYLARLNNGGKYNAWSTEQSNSWIQVDFQRPVVISQVATQGARQMFYSHYVDKYVISYSTDRRKWIFYKGDSKELRKVFDGNREAYEAKTNTFFPPVVGRFIRLHPISWHNTATVRMEFYGCELDGCSVPLGMESRLIEDHRITASSTAYSWYSGPWRPSLARLNKQGTINAWQSKHRDMNQWLQVELPKVEKITGIITQGAKALGTEMYVMSYHLQYSHSGIHWIKYTDDENVPYKTFMGNTNNNDHVKNYIYPPIFSRFIRIVPRSWTNSITMRIELLGCEFE
ncbi:coagulation factor V [Plectropomus leopardus]|uniref:coagulation factor V n=1 Tax=Plectropomus leopardus TaxID=160734 RepID=UPI001C4DBD1F|nr:coagulation factor V [Plectropomus leopardus]